jgi:N-acetylmuramoyl-L-alanine amidase
MMRRGYVYPGVHMNYSITNNKFDDVRQIETPNKGGAFKKLSYLVMHYTAGPSLEGTIRTFSDPAREVSAHLVIDRDGTVVQMVPFDRVAWHAGPSSWKPAGSLVPLKSLNFYAIGIEMVNAGPLTKTQGGKFLSWWGGEIAASEVVEVDPSLPASFGKRYWHRFPEEQVSVAIDVARTLVDTYRLKDVLGHSDIAPGRKTDPGPAFPMSNFKSVLFGRA